MLWQAAGDHYFSILQHDAIPIKGQSSKLWRKIIGAQNEAEGPIYCSLCDESQAFF